MPLRSSPQALKEAGCDEVVLAINYRPQVQSLPLSDQLGGLQQGTPTAASLCVRGSEPWSPHGRRNIEVVH